jgi:hypothetical protein
MDFDVILSAEIWMNFIGFIILYKIPIGLPLDPIRSDYRIDEPGHKAF